MLVHIYRYIAEKSVTPASGGGNAFVCAAISAGFAERVKAGAQFLLLLEYSCITEGGIEYRLYRIMAWN